MKNFSRTDVDNMLSKNCPCLDAKEIYIYGIGNTAQLYQEGLKRLSWHKQIAGYLVSDAVEYGGGGIW